MFSFPASLPARCSLLVSTTHTALFVPEFCSALELPPNADVGPGGPYLCSPTGTPGLSGCRSRGRRLPWFPRRPSCPLHMEGAGTGDEPLEGAREVTRRTEC